MYEVDIIFPSSIVWSSLGVWGSPGGDQGYWANSLSREGFPPSFVKSKSGN